MIKEKYIPVNRRQNSVDIDRGFSDGKDAFYNGNESDNSDNDDENYNEIMSSSSYLRVLPIITQNSFTSSPTRTN